MGDELLDIVKQKKNLLRFYSQKNSVNCKSKPFYQHYLINNQKTTLPISCPRFWVQFTYGALLHIVSIDTSIPKKYIIMNAIDIIF